MVQGTVIESKKTVEEALKESYGSEREEFE